KDITDSLAETPGALHIGLDLCLTDNGYDYLGLVLFRAKLDPKLVIFVERFVLECIHFKESHTGEHLAKMLVGILRNFKIEDRVWGLVGDNAANNATMMTHISKYGLKRLTGNRAHLHCLLHVFNLVAQLDDDGDNPDNDGTAPSGMLTDADDGELDDFDDEHEDPLPTMRPGSAEEAAFNQATVVLFKIRCNPRERADFNAECERLDITTPHSVSRDQITRWNSTEQMLEDGERTFDAMVAHQKKTHPPRPLRFQEEDRQTMKFLLMLLWPLKLVTDICAKAGMPTLGDVLVHYDSLTFEYTKMIRDTSLPLYVRHGAQRARGVLNKYYERSDESEMYRLGVLLHPSMRVSYL
ncbi:hypothetical protein FRC07_011613, partial [Ceratobasidium sp. 392]